MNQELKPSGKSRDNLYLILDLMPGASHNDILHAYNRAKNTYTGGSLASYSLLDTESTTEVLAEIEDAYAVLGNPSKRREYDIKMGFQSWSEEEKSKIIQGFENRKETNPTLTGPKVSLLERNLTEEKSASDVDKQISVSNTNTNTKAKAKVETENPAVRPAVASSSKFEPNPEFESQIQGCTSIDGGFLRAVRVYRSFSVESLAHRTKLSNSHILALESEDASQLPAPVYLRGHVYLVCQALNLPDPNALAKSYLDKLAAQNKLQKRAF